MEIKVLKNFFLWSQISMATKSCERSRVPGESLTFIPGFNSEKVRIGIKEHFSFILTN